jgi:hypothetical protein
VLEGGKAANSRVYAVKAYSSAPAPEIIRRYR